MIASWPLDPLSFETSNLRFKKMTPDGVDENRKYVYKATKQRGITKGRTYTSKVFIKEILDLISKLLIQYRGVHQTFPTQRWEAQFRRQGKVCLKKVHKKNGNFEILKFQPTSLGCFDGEDEAARAYDMMMIWCELHSYQSFTDVYDVSVRLSSLVLNFHFVEYEEDIDALSQISQEELVQELRRHGRVQQNLKI